MTNHSQTPSYNLKAVLKETGIRADVLRAWERRYGLPMPERTEGGHRLYSGRDIETIKWLVARQGEGVSISRAVEMWKELEAAPAGSLTSSLAINPANPQMYAGAHSSLDALRAGWVKACLAFDETAAEQVLGQAFGLYTVEAVCLEVLQRGLSEVGALWYEGRASVQQEHFTSALSLRRLNTLLTATPPPYRNQTVLVGCPPDEWHTFMPLLLALFLRRRGLKVVYLGAHVPADHFDETLAVIRPELIVLAAQQLTSAATLQRISLEISASGVPVAFGGRIFNFQPEIRKAIPGFYLGDRLEAAIDNVERLLVAGPGATQAVTPSADYMETHRLFMIMRPLIEASLGQITSRVPGLSNDHIELANHFLGDNLSASLQLGSLECLTNEIHWLDMLLEGRRMPAGLVRAYLGAYAVAVQEQLGSQGILITDWINSQIE